MDKFKNHSFIHSIIKYKIIYRLLSILIAYSCYEEYELEIMIEVVY